MRSLRARIERLEGRMGVGSSRKASCLECGDRLVIEHTYPRARRRWPVGAPCKKCIGPRRRIRINAQRPREALTQA